MNNLTEQEKKFADTFVYLFFHSHAIYAGMGAEAARVAGYDVPDDMNKADNLEKSLLGKEKSSSTLIQKLKDSGKSCLTIRA